MFYHFNEEGHIFITIIVLILYGKWKLDDKHWLSVFRKMFRDFQYEKMLFYITSNQIYIIARGKLDIEPCNLSEDEDREENSMIECTGYLCQSNSSPYKHFGIIQGD